MGDGDLPPDKDAAIITRSRQLRRDGPSSHRGTGADFSDVFNLLGSGRAYSRLHPVVANVGLFTISARKRRRSRRGGRVKGVIACAPSTGLVGVLGRHTVVSISISREKIMDDKDDVVDNYKNRDELL